MAWLNIIPVLLLSLLYKNANATGGWYLSAENENCDDACAAHNLKCSEEGLKNNNADVDTSDEVLNLIHALGGTISATRCDCDGCFGSETDVPNYSTSYNRCYRSDSSRPLSTFDCERNPGPLDENKQRLCWCDSPDQTTTTTTEKTTTTTTEKTTTTTEKRAQDCSDFTLNKCDSHLDDIIDTVQDVVTEAKCQTYCALNEKCMFYIMDTAEKICYLYKTEINSYFATCNEVGGPKEPLAEECMSSNDPCKNFIQSSCNYGGTKIEEFSEIASMEICQQYCSLNFRCKYVLFEQFLQECTLYASVERECENNMGLPEPPKEECDTF